MRERLLGLLKTYLLFVVIFVIQKPLFIFYYSSMYTGLSAMDILQVMWHGLPLDLSLAGYFSVIPGFLFLASSCALSDVLRKIWNIYYLILSILLSMIFTIDLALYEYWGFRLDATPLFYFFSSPKDAIASVSLSVVFVGIGVMLVYAGVLYLIFYFVQRSIWRGLKLPFHYLKVAGILLLVTGLLFIPIRGGFTVSTMNVGKVYFSSNQRLNHAAINPVFSLMESLAKQTDFSKQYRFMESAQADKLIKKMLDPAVLDSTAVVPDTLHTVLFNTKRPNVIFVIMESFSSKLMKSLGGEPNVAVNLDTLAQEGVLFTNFYANSFRTDRGVVAVLSGYPAQPTTSLMKYPHKIQSVPSIAGSLKKAGYRTKYYYGGDADFTNMRSYVITSGFDELISDVDFPVSERLSKWGVHDHLVFKRLLQDLNAESTASSKLAGAAKRPFFKVVQTSSSHEPFEVPYRRLTNKRLNAFAYTDSCVGDFVRHFRRLPQWKNTVIILVPDHLGAYPEHIDNLSIERYQIPLILIGGAVREPKHIPVYGSQHDIAATLLAQLALPHSMFTFSKDMLNPLSPHFAFFTVPDAFGMATLDNRVMYNCESKSVAVDEGAAKGKNLESAKAYLQKIYDDIAKR
ncbi:sulfatase-like hydrolase/transferase [Bacteroidaceae bacterium HV4-6-C5C]|nr:sulfatase-like hydrolase/transferase [Bacteroidaceae bacterium HV4-6-C5C]